MTEELDKCTNKECTELRNRILKKASSYENLQEDALKHCNSKYCHNFYYITGTKGICIICNLDYCPKCAKEKGCITPDKEYYCDDCIIEI